jgi:hypothetical protein
VQWLRSGWYGFVCVDVPEHPDLDSSGYQLGAVRALAFKGRYSQSGVSEDLQAYCIGMGMILGRAPLMKIACQDGARCHLVLQCDRGQSLQDRIVSEVTWRWPIPSGLKRVLLSCRSDYFTKYEWADLYGKLQMRGCSRKTGRADRTLIAFPGDHKAHGFYADGSESNGTTLGLWTVFSNLEGYTGGPLRSDLVVDTNIYNCEWVRHATRERIKTMLK